MYKFIAAYIDGFALVSKLHQPVANYDVDTSFDHRRVQELCHLYIRLGQYSRSFFDEVHLLILSQCNAFKIHR